VVQTILVIATCQSVSEEHFEHPKNKEYCFFDILSRILCLHNSVFMCQSVWKPHHL